MKFKLIKILLIFISTFWNVHIINAVCTVQTTTVPPAIIDRVSVLIQNFISCDTTTDSAVYSALFDTNLTPELQQLHDTIYSQLETEVT